MEVLDPGHTYLVDIYDAHVDAGNVQDRIGFMKRNDPPEKYPGNKDARPGTIIQELLRVLIDRIIYVDNQVPDFDNKLNITSLRVILYLQERRAFWRRNWQQIQIVDPRRQDVMEDWYSHFPSHRIEDNLEDVENIATCRTCGHWFCEEH